MFYLVFFNPNKNKMHFAPQNIYQNLSFVKDINVVCEKMTRNCCKIVPKPICALHFRYVFSRHNFKLGVDWGQQIGWRAHNSSPHK